MSVVVIRDRVIAADTMGSIGQISIQSGKLYRRGNTAIGTVGCYADGSLFKDWYFAGADMESLPKFENREDNKISFGALLLTADGWELWDELFYRDTDAQRNPFMALGSGAEAAMGALHMGATAIEAVQAACAVTVNCSLPVEYEEIALAPSTASAALAQPIRKAG